MSYLAPWVAGVGAMWVWHARTLCNAAAVSPAVQTFQTASLLGLGLLFWRPDPNQAAGLSHNLRTVVIDARGRVQKVFKENEWKVDDLVAEIVKAARAKP